MKPFPVLQTSRCILRQIVPSDQEEVFRGLSHPEVIRYYGIQFATYEATAEQMAWYATNYAEGTGIWWGICDQETAVWMGAIGLNNIHPVHRKAEIGFWLMPAWQGLGIIREVVPLVINYAFETLRLHRLEAFVESENLNSQKVLSRSGFHHEGTMRECEWKEGRWVSLEVWGMVVDDSEKRQNH